MRKTKLLSLLLAVLMVFSCVPALSAGVFAEESDETPEAPKVSYKDPRENATKIYYAPTLNVTADDLAGDKYYESATKIKGSTYVYSTLTNGTAGTATYEAGSVLVVKFKGTMDFDYATNTTLNRSEYLALTAPTIFRADGTKLPIVIEGVEENAASTLKLRDTAYTALGFANDYYFSNLTISKTSTKTHSFYAGSGNVVFHDVKFDLAGTITFAGDNYTSDPFFGWTEARFDANKGEDGLLSTGFTFGKNTFVASSTVLSAVAADGHSGTDAYKTSYPKIGTDLTDTNVETAVAKAKLVKYTNGKLLTNNANCVVLPCETSTHIILDNGKDPSDTADFSKVYSRKGCSPVAKAEIKLVSGNVQHMYGDAYTGDSSANGVKDTYANRPNREVYVGDTTITLDGGKLTGAVNGLFQSYLIGNYTIRMNGGDIKRINGSESGAAIKGNFLFEGNGGKLGEYYGSCPIYGTEGTVTNRISGGTYNVFTAARYGVDAVTNEISGGQFNGQFTGGATNNYPVKTVVNKISGIYDDPFFKKSFIAGSTTTTYPNTSITTTISGGEFDAGIVAGSSSEDVHTLEVVSTKATDSMKFASSSSSTAQTYAFDKFEMNGGMVHFYNVDVTASNASGRFTVRNTSGWLEGRTYFTFIPAEGQTLDIATTQIDSITTRGRVVVEGGKYLVQTADGFLPNGVHLLLTERIAMKFIFNKEDVDSVGKDNFDFAVIHDELDTNIAEGAELVENGDTYYFITDGIGLPDFKDQLTLAGGNIQGSAFTIEKLADDAITAWGEKLPAWADWAKSLKNMIGVVIDGGENTIAPADKDYGTHTATKADSVVDASATLVMNNAVGVKLELTCSALPANPVVKVNGSELSGLYTTEGNVATVSLYFAPQAMEDEFTVVILDGETEVFTLKASVACFAKALGTDAGNALLSYVQATTAVCGK